MARRIELKSITAGIANSFNSRNNDVEGYWGMGKLYAFVINADCKVVKLDLIESKTSPITNQFDDLILFYQQMLYRFLTKRKIPITWIKSASIEARFEVTYEHKYHYWRSALGKPCTIVCDIETDNGKHFISVQHNNCYPYDPRLETKITRYNFLV